MNFGSTFKRLHEQFGLKDMGMTLEQEIKFILSQDLTSEDRIAIMSGQKQAVQFAKKLFR